MKSSLKNKIKLYTTISTSLVVADDLGAQMVSTSVNYTGGYESYDIDLDNDGTTEVTLHNQDVQGEMYAFFGSAAFVEGGNAMVMTGSNGSFAGAYFYGLQGYNVARLNVSSVVGDSFNFYKTNTYGAYFGSVVSGGKIQTVLNTAGTYSLFDLPLDVFSAGNFGWYSGYSFGSGFFARATGQVTDGVVGIQFDKGGDTHYGWARLNLATSGEAWLLKDYGYEAQAGIIAYADANYASDYVYLGVSDGGNSLDASDIRIRLTTNQATKYFSNIDDYYIVLSKTVNGDLSPQDVMAAPGISVNESGSNAYDVSYETFDVDSDGDLIEQGVDYTVYVVVRDFSGRPMRMASRNITLKNTLSVDETLNDNIEISAANKYLTVKAGSTLTNKTVTVHDIMGKEVLREDLNSNFFSRQLNVTEGIYIVTVASKDTKVTKKVKF